ncbi:MAG: DNA polymerase III subunit gamma/tau [Clostridia bacterium]|jgi:DNA polymerase-3 subunit gamma/tau|nr:DNA polymerase III subunit gamma/tau [Clostridia bacterium]
MAYISLYRKYRPKDFESIVGQKHIIKTLTNQIELDRVGHAYLFCGTRGTGKTSTAKIFANLVNCENAANGKACGTCKVCIDIQNGSSLNVIEIDAASNNGVDNIREIRNEVKYPPTEGIYKVYIIDEVHMLSQGAFNALLKTLEEPPKHIIFILATTDPQKIPATILSRCQRFDFKRIAATDMVEAIKKYMENENVQIEDNAIKYIAKLSEGAMRDALSILEQCISFNYGEVITLEKVIEVLGAVDSKVFFDVIEGIYAKDAKKLLDIVEEIVMQGRDIRQFVVDLVDHLRNVLVVMTTNGYENVLDVERENIELLKKHADNLGIEAILNLINTFSELEGKLRNTSQKRIFLEVEFMKLIKETTAVNVDSNLLSKVKELECKLEQKESKIVCEPKEEKPVKVPKAIPDEVKRAVSSWVDIRNGFDIPLKAATEETKAAYLEGDIFYIVCSNDVVKDFVNKRTENIVKIMKENLGREFNLITISANEYTKRYREFYGKTEEGSNSYDDKMEAVISYFKDLGVNIEVD